MPNHVLTEVVVRNVSQETQAAILALISGRDRAIDFETLLPIPLNVWRGNVGSRHEKTFPDNALNWRTDNWGTKWNAYGLDEDGKYRSVFIDGDRLVLTFQTAWRTPYGWLLALWHKSGLPIEYSYLDEGSDRTKCGRFTTYEEPFGIEPWSEQDADEAEHRRIHKLMWGVEEFNDEDA